MKPVALFLSDQVTVPVADVLSVIKSVNNEVIAEKDVHICTYASSLKQLPVESASLSTVVSVLKDSKSLSEELLGDIFRALKPGGNLISQISPVAGDPTIKPTQTFEKKLLLSGYVDIQATEGDPIFPVDGSEVIIIKASKASWSIGSSFTIKKSVNVLPKIQIDDDSDLIDEDSLLSEDDLKRPQLPVVGDCEVSSTRKACKNCSCGRAEAESAGEKLPKLGLTLEQLNNPQSSCGNCGLGDAFRCGTCPYRGLPPFKPGEKISLAGNFLVADI